MPVRSSVELLPEGIKTELNQRLLDAQFSGYEALAEWLSEQGFTISKSAIHRYGQRFEERCTMLKASTEQAIAMKQVLGDEEAAVAEMSIQLAQSLLFNLMIERGENLSPKEMSLITRALSDSSRGAIAVRKFQDELQQKLQAKFKELEEQAQDRGLEGRTLDPDTLRRIREEVYGLF